MFDVESDRSRGYRPCVGLVVLHGRNILLGRSWGSWGIPQGGIERGETFEQATKREFAEEIGKGWLEATEGDPEFLLREELSSKIEKDGRTWRGKTYYYHTMSLPSMPDHADLDYSDISYWDFVYGIHDDEGPYPYETRGFPNGVLFMSYEEARTSVERTNKGYKGRIMLKVLEQLRQVGRL